MHYKCYPITIFYFPTVYYACQNKLPIDYLSHGNNAIHIYYTLRLHKDFFFFNCAKSTDRRQLQQLTYYNNMFDPKRKYGSMLLCSGH